ncbi:MAG: GH3 auxin-responsive promoter family protein [Bacteroidales bacterium]|nr:GH3 auxin-responsive promoter family protein [Bacteroidales bacterium]
MPLFSSLYSWLSIKRMKQIELMREYPFEFQREVFFNLIDKAKDTEFGKKYGFGDIEKVSQFQERVPVRTYDELKPMIQRVLKGEPNILWPGTTRWFAKSSGTTADKSKFIPVTEDALNDCHFRGGKDILAIYLSQFPESKVLAGKSLSIGGSHQINEINNDAYYGDLSAVIIQNLPFWAEIKRTPKLKTALIADWEEKMEKMARETINDNVTSIAGVPSWTLVLMRRILEITGKTNLLEIWPDLEAFFHGGVSFLPYQKQFKEIIPSEKMHFLETYNASEGFFALQDDISKDDLLLVLDYGIFYEFIPFDELEDGNYKALTIAEVEKEKNYAMVISTNGGLWRYLIGDTVKFTSLYPHKIKITGRIKHYINVFGEELMVDNVEEALKTAIRKTNSAIADYTVAPVFMDKKQKGRHQWAIEFVTPPKDLEYFTDLLDNALKSVNSDYEAKRYKDLSIQKLTIDVVKPGTFYRWLQERGKLGGQNKVPRLSNNRKFLEEILKLNEA